MICVLWGYTVRAQNTSPPYLKIGEKLPDVAMTNLINYTAPAARLSDFRGKIIIIDFWATWCGSCIHALPEEEALQQEFEGKVQFLLVTREKEQTVAQFLERSRQYHRTYPHLTYVTDDTRLHQLIKVSGYPTFAWIDKNGVLRDVTDYDQVTRQNILKLLHGDSTVKKPAHIDIHLEQPFFIAGNGGNQHPILTYSVLSRYVDGIASWSGAETRHDTGWIYNTNVPVKLLYQRAYYDAFARLAPEATEVEGIKAPSLYSIPNCRTLLELKDSAGVVGIVNDTINKKALYCYQLIVPAKSNEQMRTYMREDLSRYFSYQVRVEKRKVTCLVLSVADRSKLRTSGGTPRKDITNFHFYGSNLPFRRLVFFMNYGTGLPPVIDETGFSGNVDLRLDFNSTDWKTIAAALKSYGLDLRLEEREIYMLVIGDVV